MLRMNMKTAQKWLLTCVCGFVDWGREERAGNIDKVDVDDQDEYIEFGKIILKGR